MEEKRIERVLIIDDEPPIRDILAREIGKDYNTITAEDGNEGLRIVKEQNPPIVVIVDIKMPGISGLDVLEEIKKFDKDIEVIMITGFATMETAVRSLRDGAFDFINKPFDLGQVQARVKKAVESYHSKKTIGLLNEGLKQTYIELERLKDSLEEKVYERTQELAVSEKKYRSIIDDSFDAIVILDDDMKITSWNNGAKLIFGYKEPEIKGKSIEILIAEDKVQTKQYMLDKIRNEKYFRDFTAEFLTLDKGNIFVNITASDIEGEGFCMVLRDITRERMVDQMKSDFVSNVSHELRTPLTSIKGAIELILAGSEGPLTDSQKEFLNITKNNSIRLIRLISDLLDLSKIESGKIKMDIKPNELVKACQETIKEFKSVAEKKKILIVYDGPEKYPELPFDEDRIRQVITNLIGNAMKFTPEGGSITVKLEDAGPEVYIRVIDTGMGISKENFKLVFEKFQQVDSSSTRARGGTGLGLAITKSIVEAHKGRIWVESEVGKGSTFAFSLNNLSKEHADKIKEIKSRQVLDEIDTKKPPKEAFTVKKVLVIDDDQDMVKVIKGHLEKENYDITVVSSSKEALKSAIDIKPDLITLDLLMPNVDGFTITDLLKQNPATKNIPIVIISAIFEKEKAFKLGVADYITKPFEPKELVDSIKNIESQITGQMQKKKILVVDDDPDISSVLALSLNDKNYSVLNAYDGLQAVATAKLEKPNIIILDLMLPEMDGFQVLKKMKSDEETKHIPIIVITGRTVTDKERAIKLGAREYLIKPFTMKILLNELDNILKEGISS